MGESFYYFTEEVYNAVIDATIDKCSQTQSSRVLEALKTRWKDALNRRIQNATQTDSKPSSEFSSARNMTVVKEEDRTLNTSHLEPAKASRSTTETHEAAKTKAESNASPIKHMQSSGTSPSIEDDDDEFDDAAVDVSGEPVKSGSQSDVNEYQSNSMTSPAITSETQTSGGRGYEGERNVNDLDDSDLSDLDDPEPETRDYIVAQFEKVLRPSGKKTASSTHWKVLLRNGIIQLNGQEILFDKLSGEFSFR